MKPDLVENSIGAIFFDSNESKISKIENGAEPDVYTAAVYNYIASSLFGWTFIHVSFIRTVKI